MKLNPELTDKRILEIISFKSTDNTCFFSLAILTAFRKSFSHFKNCSDVCFKTDFISGFEKTPSRY